MELQQQAKLCKALSDETRLQILQLLEEMPLCGAQLLEQVRVGQPTLSHHLKILAEAELIALRPEGKFVYYSRNTSRCMQALEGLQALLSAPEAKKNRGQAVMPSYLL